MTTYKREIELLEREWSDDSGFFWQVRQGRFDALEFERAFKRVATLPIAALAELPRRLVSLLWYIPLFMHWQFERVNEAGGDTEAYAKAVTMMTNEVERLLGVP